MDDKPVYKNDQEMLNSMKGSPLQLIARGISSLPSDDALNMFERKEILRQEYNKLVRTLDRPKIKKGAGRSAKGFGK